jgi:protein KRI1
MDCDYNPEENKKKKIQDELIEMSKGRKRRKKTSMLAEIIRKEKPAFDPATSEKTYEEYLDEYYKLDYEDIIGDQPCRFKYTECVPNDFGLTVEEVRKARLFFSVIKF